MHQRFTIVPIVAALSIVIAGEAWGQKAYVELRSGMRLGPGLVSSTETSVRMRMPRPRRRKQVRR